MLSLKENFFETLKNGKPDAFVNEWEVFPQVWDPIFYYMYPIMPMSGQTVKNPLGVSIFWGENEPGAMPIVNEETKVIRDVTKWRDYVEFFDFRDRGLDWTQAKADADKIRADGKFVMVWNVTGLFEMSHFLMGFEDTLCNLLEEPEAMHDLINAIKDFKIKQQEYIIDELKPDVLMTHDDWGSKRALFMSPDIWREFYKEPWREIFKTIKSRGVITMHHADSYCEPIVKDMVDLGIDIWQGVLPSNDIMKIKKETDHKLVLMGGIDASIVDRADWTEDVVRAETERACREYRDGGMFIPCLTYGGEGSIFPGVNDCIMDEIRKQDKIYFK
ncbi:MAG: uroporphyrinogen decarboxylase (URO-D) [Oscillospiraceae bacterium]|jgi:hypothetical protein|nr:uroporphyrinogen decarboxylase (URO-D) [Oscillospiraceae bacterium]